MPIGADGHTGADGCIGVDLGGFSLFNAVSFDDRLWDCFGVVALSRALKQ